MLHWMEIAPAMWYWMPRRVFCAAAAAGFFFLLCLQFRIPLCAPERTFCTLMDQKKVLGCVNSSPTLTVVVDLGSRNPMPNSVREFRRQRQGFVIPFSCHEIEFTQLSLSHVMCLIFCDIIFQTFGTKQQTSQFRLYKCCNSLWPLQACGW